MYRLVIALEDDRLKVAAILVRNGYTVRQTKERLAGKKSYKYILEYEKPIDQKEEKPE